jgi:beta-D-xylosidase 4
MNFGVGDYQKVHYAPGCADTACEGGDLIPDAVAVASNADAVVLVVGLTQEQETESLDRTSLLLPGFQQDLISAVANYANGCPVVLVIMSAGPVDISVAKEDSRIQSIMWVGYPVEAGGQAIANIIFGYHNPGKLQFQQ